MDQAYTDLLEILGGALQYLDKLLFPEQQIVVALVEELPPDERSPLAAYVPDMDTARRSGIPDLYTSRSEQELYAIYLPNFEETVFLMYDVFCTAYKRWRPHSDPDVGGMLVSIAGHEVRHRFQMRRKPALFSRVEQTGDAVTFARLVTEMLTLPEWCSKERQEHEFDAQCIQAMLACSFGNNLNDNQLRAILTASP